MKYDPLEPLKQAGRSATPAFSEALHARVMRDVRRSVREEPGRREWVGWAVGVSVAVAAMVVAVLWLKAPPVREGKPVVVVSADALQPVRELEEMVKEAADKVGESRYAYLDRDGRRFVAFLMSHVPSVPARKQGEERGS